MDMEENEDHLNR